MCECSSGKVENPKPKDGCDNVVINSRGVDKVFINNESCWLAMTKLIVCPLHVVSHAPLPSPGVLCMFNMTAIHYQDCYTVQ